MDVALGHLAISKSVFNCAAQQHTQCLTVGHNHCWFLDFMGCVKKNTKYFKSYALILTVAVNLFSGCWRYIVSTSLSCHHSSYISLPSTHIIVESFVFRVVCGQQNFWNGVLNPLHTKSPFLLFEVIDRRLKPVTHFGTVHCQYYVIFFTSQKTQTSDVTQLDKNTV